MQLIWVRFSAVCLFFYVQKKFIRDIDLTPRQYLEIKARLIKESYVRGMLKAGQAPQLFKIGH